MKKVLASSLVLLFVAVISPLYAVDPTTSITAYAKTSDNLPVEGLSISISKTPFSDAGVTDAQGKYIFDLSSEGAGDYTVTISLSGSNYELVSGEQASKSVPVLENESKSVYFGVKEKTTPDPEDETTTISIPSEFYATGSKTTVLKDMSSDQLKSVSDFTLHKPGLAKIEYSGELDLSSTSIINKLKSLDQYVFIEIPGEVTVASDLVPELDAPATVTFEGLNFIQLSQGYTPQIMQDDQEAGGGVSNVSLINGDKISFDVDGFSTYAVRPTFEFEENEIETTETSYTLQGKIDDLDAQISIYINDESQDIEISINDNGEFEIPIELSEMENIVQILAVGVSEQTYSEVVKITNPNLEEAAPESSGMKISLTMIFGILLLAMAIGGGIGYYYYNRRQKTKLKKPAAKYDSRLLTPEERKTLSSETTQTRLDKKPDKQSNDAEEKQIPKL
ncbi:hypothetical protein JW978_03135 [Candidatus Dojkabacteria bacterium]|nr:hypothetical protein [Candidatus Dojkabacteria bacterium]